MGSELDQDPAFEFFHKVPTSSICLILQTDKTDKQTKRHENNSSLTELITYLQEISIEEF